MNNIRPVAHRAGGLPLTRIDDYLSTLHSECLAAASGLRFDKTHPWHFLLVTLYGSLVELAGCVLILARSDGSAGLGAVLRAQLEVYVDLVNLADDRSYLEFIDAANLKQLQSIYSAAADGNAWIVEITESPLFSSTRDDVERQLKELDTKGIRPLRIHQKFERAGLSELYDGVYAMLCTDAHSNRSVLVARHVEPLGDEDFRVSYYKPASESELLAFMDSSAGLLQDASERAYKALECEVPAKLRARLNELAVVRDYYCSADGGV